MLNLATVTVANGGAKTEIWRWSPDQQGPQRRPNLLFGHFCR